MSHDLNMLKSLIFFFMNSDTGPSFKEILPLNKEAFHHFPREPPTAFQGEQTVGCIPSIEVVNSEVADGAHLRDVNHFEAADEIFTG